MRHTKLMRAVGWIAGVLVLAWMLGVVPVVPAPVDQAQAGFFDKVKDKSSNDNSPAASDNDKPKAKDNQQGSSSGGFFGGVKSKETPPPSPAPQPPPQQAAPPDYPSTPPPAPPAPYSKPDSNGGFFGGVKSKQPSAPPQSAPDVAPQAYSTRPPSYTKPQPDGGFFGSARERPQMRPDRTPPAADVNPPRRDFGPRSDRRPGSGAPSQGGFFQRRPDAGWQNDRSVLGHIQTTPPKRGWTSQGYFEELRRARETRRHRDRDIVIHYWYYPYDFAYYAWWRYHSEPWYVWPYYYGYAYPQYYYYYYTAPPIVVTAPYDWIYGETYIPYASYPSNSLVHAREDIEQAWRRERIELISAHLDPEHAISCYFRDEFTHDLSADEFTRLTLDAFSSIRTVSFDLSSVRYVSSRDWARLQGRHVFYDPNDQRTVVYVSYLLHRVDYSDYPRWVIWEVRQSPYPQ